MGGIHKCTADRLVAHRWDINNTYNVFTALEADISVKHFKVNEQDVSNVDRYLPSGLKTISGTMTFDKIVATMPRQISCQKFNCFCSYATGNGNSGECYNPFAVSFLEPTSSPE